MHRLFGNLSTLMGASFLVQASNGAITTLIAILIAQRGGTQSDVSLIAACYSLGFAAGCFLSPSQARRVGLIRAYAAAAAVCTITIVGLELLDGPILWALLRFMMGASIAAVLAVSDAWMNANTRSQDRGRMIAGYSIVLGLAAIASQLIFLGVNVETDGLVLVFAISMNIAVVLVALSSTNAPSVSAEEHSAGPNFTITSPAASIFTFTSLTATTAAFVGGFAVTAIISIVPFYLSSHGAPSERVALVLISLYLGRLLFQWPIGSISDRRDRRSVLMALSLGIVLLMALMMATWAFGMHGEGRIVSGAAGPGALGLALVYAVVLGGILFPLYSVASSLAFDRSASESIIQASTTLLLVYSFGSIVGPLTVMVVSNIIGDMALPLSVLIACLILCIVSLMRKITVETPVEHTPTAAVPVSSIAMAETAAEMIKEPAEAENSNRGGSL